MQTVTLIGKGPSASHAQEWIDSEPTDVAVINEVGVLLRETQPIHYGFFTHSSFLYKMPHLWDRIQTFSGPSEFHHPQLSERFPDNLPVGFPIDKYRPYRDWNCCGDRQSMINRIVSGGIVHHHTSTGAHHWLAKQGYRRIRLIGFGGGSGYASGLDGHVPPEINLGEWTAIHRELSVLIDAIYGTETEWFE